MNIILELNAGIQGRVQYLGVSIDFRFRSSLKDFANASMEQPLMIDGKESSQYSYIYNEIAIKEDSDDRSITEQVSWHPFSDAFFDFSHSENQVLKKIKLILENIRSREEKERLLSELEQSYQIYPSTKGSK